MSKVIFDKTTNSKASHLVAAMQQTTDALRKEVTGQYGRTIKVQTGDVTIVNSQLDIEFNIPFDDDTEANEAEILIYNLSDNTIKNIKSNAKIVVTAGYKKDTGVIFSGFISAKKTYYNDCDKITKIYALDDMNLKEKDIESITFAAGTKASKILKYLCQKVKLPLAEFTVKRDYTYNVFVK